MIKPLVLVLVVSLLLACNDEQESISNTVAEPEVNLVFPDLTQTRLLSDEELRTPELDPAPSPNEQYLNWTKENHYKLRSLIYDDDFSDLIFLDEMLEGKRIVQLGESTHGSREFNQAKVRLIKYMHQKLDYKVIAFESSLVGCHIQNKSVAQITAREATMGCIFSVWYTKEVEELFDYIIQSHKTDNPLLLAGFDIQISGQSDTIENYQMLFERVVSNYDPDAWLEFKLSVKSFFDMRQAHLECNSRNITSSCDHFNQYLDDSLLLLQQLESFLYSHVMLKAKTVADELARDSRLALLAARSMQEFLKQMDAGKGIKSSNIRDHGMATNLTALAERIYPSEKIIAWAHNGHIATDTYNNRQWLLMGQHLKSHWQDELYTLGFYMIRGQHADNSGKTLAISTNHKDDSLESVAYGLRTAAAYIPFAPEDQQSLGDDWLHQPFVSKSWGTNDISMVLGKAYDAVIVIDHSQAPEFLSK